MTVSRGRKRRVLCISPYFPPLANAEATCSGKIVRELLSAGVEVTVLSVAYPNDQRHYAHDTSPVWRAVEPVAIAVPGGGRTRKLFSGLFALKYQVSSFPRWLEEVSALAAERHQKIPFHAIYSRSYPIVAHVAAFWLKRTMRLPWIANINDPWDIDMVPNSSARGEMLQPLSRLWMRRVFTFADVVTFPSQRLLDFHRQIQHITTKTAVIPHIGYAAPAKETPPLFVVVHAGRLGSAEVTRRGVTKSLLEGFAAFCSRLTVQDRAQVRLRFVGPYDRETESWAAEFKITDNVEFTGRVDYAASLEHIRAASVCLLVEGRFPVGIFLPSKLADYLVADKPVVALSPRVGAVADLAAGHRGIRRVDVDDAGEISDAFTACYVAYSKGQLAGLAPSMGLKAHFDRKVVCQSFMSLLDNVTESQL